jgi:hypothetical protein
MPNFSRGIFIIQSDIELPTFTGDIPVIGYQNSKESQESLQRLNLMNAIVSVCACSRVTALFLILSSNAFGSTVSDFLLFFTMVS